MDIQINETDYAVSLFIIMENKIALSELTRIDFVVDDYADMIKKEDFKLIKEELKNVNAVFYFSRLNVPEKIRGRGIGKELMEKTIQFCDEKNYMLINTVNPYGDMNLEELNQFYEKSGMKLVNKDGLLIYSKNLNSKKINNLTTKPKNK
jgi:predicted GNAT family acetyltransferase